MQGENAPRSIAKAFDQINNLGNFFDLVVLIRGGGASLDLLCFDDYELAYYITQFPLPVITGIGHDRDVSVADMVAHTSAKTPTAVAEFLISGAARVLDQVNSYSRDLKQLTRQQLFQHQSRLERLTYNLLPGVRQVMTNKRHYLQTLGSRLPGYTKSYIQRNKQDLTNFQRQISIISSRVMFAERQSLKRYTNQIKGLSLSLLKHSKIKLDMLDKNMHLNDPLEVLKRGFTITVLKGKVVKDAGDLSGGDLLETHFRDGKVLSEVRTNGEK